MVRKSMLAERMSSTPSDINEYILFVVFAISATSVAEISRGAGCPNSCGDRISKRSTRFSSWRIAWIDWLTPAESSLCTSTTFMKS